MKKYFTITAALSIFTLTIYAATPNELPKPREIAVPEGVDPDLVKEAGNKAIKALLTDFFQRRDIQIKRFAVLPMQRDLDGGYFTDQFRNLFSTQGGNNGFEL